MEITLTLPDELYERAERWATITRRDLPEALTDALAIALTPVYTTPWPKEQISSLSDEEVLTLCEAQMKPAQGQRLNKLLEKQREGTLTESECPELLALMQIYEQLWIRQSEALAEAVRRGLREPLEP